MLVLSVSSGTRVLFSLSGGIDWSDLSPKILFDNFQKVYAFKGLGSIRGVFGPMSKISFTLSNYSFVIWDMNYRRYFVI